MAIAIALLSVVAAACSSESNATPPAGQTVPPSPASPVAPATPALAGRWEQARHCRDLVKSLDQLGLGTTAPAAVGDFFPNVPAQQLANKPAICSGAKPSPHSHFFTSTGQFGSLDQALSQVDNGHYALVNANTVQINGSKFHYTITGGNTLALDPVITSAMRAKALSDPLKFSTAVWMVTVAYPGTTWTRVSCGSWC